MRQAETKRVTKETSIEASICLDGGNTEISTGLAFFDHMLDQLSRHGRIGLKVKAAGDYGTGSHHTCEDVGIVLGQIMKNALGDMRGITRFGWAVVPMDEALAMVSMDICGRGSLYMDAASLPENIGDTEGESFREFFKSFCVNSGIACHIRLISGENGHHKIECIFKAFAQALKQALKIEEGQTDVPSTKGVL